MATTETKKKTYDENLQKEIQKLIDKKVFELSTIARGINKSPATLSLYLRSNYEGRIDELEKDLTNYLRFLQRKENVELKSLNFVETTIVRKLFNAANMCQMKGKMGVCYGAPGIGKSTAVVEYQKSGTGVILVDPYEQSSTREVLKQIAEQLKLNYTQNSTIDEFTSSVIKKLEKNKYLIVIDEAENLKVDIFKIIRKIHDKTKNNCGILLIGTDALYEILKKVKNGFPYITSRIGYITKLDSLKLDDVEKLTTQYFPNISKKLISFIAKSCHFNARAIQNLLDLCVEIMASNNTELNEDVIEAAKENLLI